MFGFIGSNNLVWVRRVTRCCIVMRGLSQVCSPHWHKAAAIRLWDCDISPILANFIRTSHCLIRARDSSVSSCELWVGGMSDKEQLIGGGEVVVYRRRWYILALFSLLAMFQCCVWNTWGPVVDVATLVYPSWTQGTLSLLANWASIAFLVFMLPVLYLQNRNLRSAVLLTSSLIALGRYFINNKWYDFKILMFQALLFAVCSSCFPASRTLGWQWCIT